MKSYCKPQTRFLPLAAAVVIAISRAQMDDFALNNISAVLDYTSLTVRTW